MSPPNVSVGNTMRPTTSPVEAQKQIYLLMDTFVLLIRLAALFRKLDLPP